MSSVYTLQPNTGGKVFIFLYFQKWKLSLSTQSCIILFTKIFLLLLPLFIFYSLLTFTSFLSCFLHHSPSLHNPGFFTSLSFLSLFSRKILFLTFNLIKNMKSKRTIVVAIINIKKYVNTQK